MPSRDLRWKPARGNSGRPSIRLRTPRLTERDLSRYDCGMRRFLIAVILLQLATAPSYGADDRPAKTLTIRFPSGEQIEAEVADSEGKRSLGLMFRQTLPANRGMLFIFPVAGIYPFWMKNCRFPIDILWLSADKTIVHVAQRVPPCLDDPCPSYDPHVAALYVIEVVSGFAAQQGLHAGTKVQF